MIEFYIIRRIFNLTRDILFAYFYLNTVDQPRRGKAMRAAGFGVLMLLYAMFGSEDGGVFATSEVRLVYRAVCFFVYLMLSVRMDWKMALYDALLVDCIIIIGHNLFLTPLTRPVLLGDAQILASPLGSKVLSLTLVQLVMLPMMYGVYRQLPLRCIRSVGRTQLILLVTVAGCSMYLNSMLRLITDNRIPTGVELSVFSIILQFALLLCLVLMEQSQYNLRSHAAAQMQLSRVQATLERARRDHQADERIRKIHHDLNNHMSSLQYLIGDGEYDKAAQYIERFRSTIPVKEAAIHTGNTMLDSLLTEKAAQAEGIGAEVMITADLTGLGAISDFDLCTIFGNILDNAIEACSQVTQPRGRYIHLRSAAYAGYTVITLSNSYEGERLRAPFSFKTTKADAENHGYGLANVRAALDKYGGVLSAKAYQHKQQFALSIMIPQEIKE